MQSLTGRELDIAGRAAVFRNALSTGPTAPGEFVASLRHHPSSREPIPNRCSGTALPGDRHHDQGPPRHGAALYLRKGNDVAPVAPPGHQPPSLVEFMDGLKGLKGTRPPSRFTLELGNRRSSRARAAGICGSSFCLAASRASSAHTTPCSLGAPRAPAMGPLIPREPRGPVVLPGLFWSWGLSMAAWEWDIQHAEPQGDTGVTLLSLLCSPYGKMPSLLCK